MQYGYLYILTWVMRILVFIHIWGSISLVMEPEQNIAYEICVEQADEVENIIANAEPPMQMLILGSCGLMKQTHRDFIMNKVISHNIFRSNMLVVFLINEVFAFYLGKERQQQKKDQENG